MVGEEGDVGEEGEDRIQGEGGGGRGRCAVGLHGSLPTAAAAAAVSFVDRMDCIGSVQTSGGGDVDSVRRRKKQRGISKTYFRKKDIALVYVVPSRANTCIGST